MTTNFFKEWIKELDHQFCSTGQHVTLTLNNFPGHIIPYEPMDIKFIYFEPNLTSYIQPLDAGIIQCFKAHYHKAFCSHAVDLDEVGEEDIYKINLLEIMLLVWQAWDAVSSEAITHCWRHTGITEYVYSN